MDEGRYVTHQAKAPTAMRQPFRRLAALALTLAVAALAAPAPASAAPPVTVIGGVSDVLGGSAHVTGEVDPGGFSYYTFEYSTDEVNWSGFTYEGVADGEGLREVSTDLHGLKGSTRYFVRLTAMGETEVSSLAPNLEFETLAVDPPVVTSVEDAAGVMSTVATLSGGVERPSPANPDPAFDVDCRFEYIADAFYDANESNSEPPFTGASAAACNPNPVTAVDPPEVEAGLTGLAPATTYHFRLVASNAGGSDSKEATSTFTTQALAPPVVSIDPVVTFTATTAHFSGHVDSAGTDPASAANWHFQCTPDCPGLAEGSVPADDIGHEVEADATGLQPNTTYQVELVASNGGGPSSDAASFQTPAVGPAVRTYPAFALAGGTKALLGGTVNPNNSATDYWIEYGPTAPGPVTYPNKAPLPAPPGASAGSGGAPVFVTEELQGLAPAASYHYRLVAENSVGEVQGDDVVFETAPAPATPLSCPNSKLRAETTSTALPGCRAYEMTTPPDKNGGDANGVAASSADANRVGYYSFAGFGDAHANSTINTYMAERGPSGWASHSMEPPYVSTGLPGTQGGYVIADFSADLSKTVSFNRSGPEPLVQNVFQSSEDGSTRWVTAPTVAGAPIQEKFYVGRSADASHIVFESLQDFSDGEADEGAWEWVDGQVRPIPDGHLGTGINASNTAATGFIGALPEPTVVSADGSRIFLEGGSQDVIVREDGTVTRILSLSQRSGSDEGQSPAEPAFYRGAAVDGSRAYFVTEAQLTDDAPVGGGLYSYNLETDVLSFIGRGERVLISADGRRVYFTSTEQLVPGRGVAGGRNLYTVDDEGNGLDFVATLAADDDVGPDTNQIPSRNIAATPDGENFAFQSSERLTAFDNAGHKELYLYDVAEGSLRCVSCAPDSDDIGDASLNALKGRPRGLADDGSQVLFQTSAALVPEDVNGRLDVYLYDEGQLSLISTGTSKYDSESGDISPSGGDIFFVTRDSLVGQDIDGGSRDVYDARVDGGFPAPAPPQTCEGESCQGQAGAPPVFSTPATASFSGKGNPAGRKACKKRSKKRKQARCAPKAKKHPKRGSQNRRGK